MPVKEIKTRVEKSTLLRAFELMATAKAMTELYEEKREICVQDSDKLIQDLHAVLLFI